MSAQETVLLWHNTDLRVFDNPALTAAAEAGPVVGLVVFDDVEQRAFTDLERDLYLIGAHELTQGYARLGAELNVLSGDATARVIEALRAVGASRLLCSRRYVDPRGRYRRGLAQRDLDVLEAARAAGYGSLRLHGNTTRDFEETLPDLSRADYADEDQLPLSRPPLQLEGRQLPGGQELPPRPEFALSADPLEWSEEELYAALKIGTHSIRQLWREYPALRGALLDWEYGLYQRYWALDPA
ncbi:deoxyribodipyrimidine photolyase [Deinobacterium chartae]|uniref:Deoxyribodipyrimidine photolyase n=1 Tax=Deinobacterium chartae TaxID=521158 RepID=A0A841HYQ3_9DEIO|nr:deoxyribodipyrimidine photo-lyase [Deinobacterium chartae]MBB6097032.1 deoxyribodipyrimidine photolyase [Deinobacterium chartae]